VKTGKGEANKPVARTTTKGTEVTTNPLVLGGSKKWNVLSDISPASDIESLAVAVERHLPHQSKITKTIGYFYGIQ